jgi:hypothetical protein
MLPPTRSGMTEASTTRSRSIEDAQLAIDHRRAVALRAHPAGAERESTTLGVGKQDNRRQDQRSE